MSLEMIILAGFVVVVLLIGAVKFLSVYQVKVAWIRLMGAAALTLWIVDCWVITDFTYQHIVVGTIFACIIWIIFYFFYCKEECTEEGDTILFAFVSILTLFIALFSGHISLFVAPMTIFQAGNSFSVRNK